jgi:hypothetical protein
MLDYGSEEFSLIAISIDAIASLTCLFLNLCSQDGKLCVLLDMCMFTFFITSKWSVCLFQPTLKHVFIYHQHGIEGAELMMMNC